MMGKASFMTPALDIQQNNIAACQFPLWQYSHLCLLWVTNLKLLKEKLQRDA